MWEQGLRVPAARKDTRCAACAYQMHRAKCRCIGIAREQLPCVLKISLISLLSSAKECE